MTTKWQVIATHRQHRDWDDQQIADHLDCTPEYVRATAKRNNLILPTRMKRALVGQKFLSPSGELLITVRANEKLG